MYKITIEESFSAAHSLKDYSGPCSRTHGHNYKVIVSVEAENLDELGLAIDFHELKSITRKHIDLLDHQNLNDLDFFSFQNPSAENIARFFYTRIEEELPAYVKLIEIKIAESDCCTVSYSEKKHNG